MEKWSGYHLRSLVETKMDCIKLLGDKLSAKHFSSQFNEIHWLIIKLLLKDKMFYTRWKTFSKVLD